MISKFSGVYNQSNVTIFKTFLTYRDYLNLFDCARMSVFPFTANKKKVKRKVQGMPQSQTAALPRHQEEEETDKSKQAQIEQMYEKH